MSGSRGGRAGLTSRSQWVGYTGSKSITISGYANMSNIYSGSALGTRSVSGGASLPNVGIAPPDVTVTAPTTKYISELQQQCTISWTRCNDYSGAATYRAQYSVNGGAWTTFAENIPNGTLSVVDTIAGIPGRTIQYRVDTHNNVGASAGWAYSGILTQNTVHIGSVGNIATYNPFTTPTLSIPINTGYQTMGGAVINNVHFYHGNTGIAATTISGSGNATFNVNTSTLLSLMGPSRYIDSEFRVAFFVTNSNGTRSDETIWKNFTININTDGGATPTLAAPTLSGGCLGYPKTCFIENGITPVGITSGGANLRRAPSGTTLSYKINFTGMAQLSGSSGTHISVPAGAKTATVVVTDSRGLSASASVNLQVQSYSAPTIRSLKADRLDSPNTSGKVTYSISYCPIYANGLSGTNLNAITVQQLSKNGGAFANYTSGATITGLDTELSYKVKVRVADKIKTTTYIESDGAISTIKNILSLRKTGVGIQCVPTSGYALDVNGAVRFNGPVTYVVGGRNRTPITMLNGAEEGDGIKIEGGGVLIMGCGESPTSLINNVSIPATQETTFITSDNTIRMFTGLQNPAARKEFTFHTTGDMTMTGGINTGLRTGTWIAGSKGTSIINSTSPSNAFTTFLSGNSSTGRFSLNMYNSNVYLSHQTTASINAGSNAPTSNVLLSDMEGNCQYNIVNCANVSAANNVSGAYGVFANNVIVGGGIVARSATLSSSPDNIERNSIVVNMNGSNYILISSNGGVSSESKFNTSWTGHNGDYDSDPKQFDIRQQKNGVYIFSSNGAGCHSIRFNFIITRS